MALFQGKDDTDAEIGAMLFAEGLMTQRQIRDALTRRKKGK